MQNLSAKLRFGGKQTIGVFRIVTKFLSICGGFCFGQNFHRGSSFGDFDPLKTNYNTCDIQQAHPHTKPHLLGHHTSKSVANCGLQASRRNKNQKNSKKKTRIWKVYISLTCVVAHIQSISTKFDTLNLSDVIIRSKFRID